LGEGLHWDDVRNCLWGVDIQGQLVWRWSIGMIECDAWSVGQKVGWVIPIAGDDGHILLGLQSGVAKAPANDPSKWALTHHLFVNKLGLRLNDAKADQSGAIWCGSLNIDDETQALGSLFRVTPKEYVSVDSGYLVPNGPAIHPNQKIMMHSDSGRREIYHFDLDVESGLLSNKRLWKRFTDIDGFPDGMTFDAEGCLWVAHWGGGCISRFNLKGELLLRLNLPTTNITNVCFGGQDLDRLFITSAREGLSNEQLIKEPLAGRVFEVNGHGVRGIRSLPAGKMFAK
jgi:sugar lactone lactonase YvrE